MPASGAGKASFPAYTGVLAAFVPIWALTVLGYLVGRSGMLGDRAELVLGRLVFHVAMPPARRAGPETEALVGIDAAGLAPADARRGCWRTWDSAARPGIRPY